MTTAAATIIGAAIGAAASIIVGWINNRKQIALIVYQLEELQKKQDKHNRLIERTFKLEETAAVHAEKLKVANNRISDLERNAGGEKR